MMINNAEGLPGKQTRKNISHLIEERHYMTKQFLNSEILIYFFFDYIYQDCYHQENGKKTNVGKDLERRA